MDRCSGFLERHMLNASAVDEEKVLSFFMSEMDEGLRGGKSSLQMIPTYIGTDAVIEDGKSVIVLDAGGTNFRTCLVTFHNGEPEISDFRKVPMPGSDREVSASEFFSILADNTERLIDRSDRIGFCFSYAAEITDDHDGIPLIFSKEIKAPEVIGKRLGKELLAELGRRGHDVSGKKVSVVNDTVATLLAAKAAYPENASSYIGFILGTGTNTAYAEENGNILKIKGQKSGRQIINVESGCLALTLGDIDREFIASTKDPGSYLFEKMISGAYLGQFSALVIEKAIEEGVLSQSFAERYHSIEKLNTTRMSHYLEMCHNMDYDLVRCVEGNEDDASSLYRILKAIIERAGKLTAINLTAAVIRSGGGIEPRLPAVINADGTTFYKTEFLEFYTRLYLDRILEKKHGRFFRIVNCDSSPVLGAAIAGLSI